MTPFSQQAWACRCEWGPGAVEALAPADVTIVIDIFSFTTCVDVATSRGAAILPYPWKDASAAAFARAQGAELAGRRRESLHSLAPESFLEVPKGLRCVLPSPNGAQVTLAAAQRVPVVLAGSVRNAPAVAVAAQQLGNRFNIIPAASWRGEATAGTSSLRENSTPASASLGSTALRSWPPDLPLQPTSGTATLRRFETMMSAARG